ncbi:MAG: hypothetical protein ABIG96_01675 [Candidatus Micrarchaeota archaeon]
MKYISIIRERLRKEPAFTRGDMKRLFPKISSNYLNLLIHTLLKKKEIFRISRGIYTFHDDAQVVGFGFRPFYYGCQEALSIRGIWEQETNPVIVTPRKVRAGMRHFEGGNYLVKRISRSMFFGFDLVRIGNYWVSASDLEKTLIDMVYFRQHIPREVLMEMRGKLSVGKMDSYLQRCPARVASKVRRMLE